MGVSASRPKNGYIYADTHFKGDGKPLGNKSQKETDLKTILFLLMQIKDLRDIQKSNESRNFQAWLQIWKDDSAENFLKSNQTTVEGLATIQAIEEIAQKYNLDLPILHSLYLIVYKNTKPSDVLKVIMELPLKKE